MPLCASCVPPKIYIPVGLEHAACQDLGPGRGEEETEVQRKVEKLNM